MNNSSLRECVNDLERANQLVRIEQEVDPYLEAAEIHRRVFQAGGPAIYYAHVKNSRFPMVSNLFGSMERVRFIFRHTLRAVERIVSMKVDPMQYMLKPWEYALAAKTAYTMFPKSVSSGPVLEHQCRISDIPQVQSWKDDGGAFITLPQVYTEEPGNPNAMKSNLGMYRIQLSGGEYIQDQEIGLHYQIHRGIGVHHAQAIERGEPLRANIFIGGPPAMSVAAVMPLPEGLPEITFVGALSGRRIPLWREKGKLPIHVNADFCITGTIDSDKRKPEGPFGDHLGYYSLAHDFPVFNVEKVYHRRDAIYPFTVVGRPPQEDTMFGALIHELTGDVIPTVLPGVKAVHAVDAAGVHPLLLAIGSERYVPYQERTRPQELLTQANAMLGQGQISLAKYLLIAACQDNPELDIHDIEAFFKHILERVDWTRDLHFQTCTTIDTLDYSGSGLNEGSKVVIAAVGKPKRGLPCNIHPDLQLPDGFSSPKMCMPGIVAVHASKHEVSDNMAERFCSYYEERDEINRFPLILLVDDSDFCSRTLNNWIWAAFTRSNPAVDIHGISSFIEHKHWGCRGSLVIDARYKSYQAPPLVEDPEITKRVDALGAPGGPLHGII